MKKLKMIGGNTIIEFGIRNIKFLIAKDYETLYGAIQCIKCATQKEESEYRVENQQKNEVYINDNKISLKSIKLWEVSSSYSIYDDRKLQSNSLLTQYLISKMESSIFNETMQTLDVLLQSYIDELNEEEIGIEAMNVNAKQLLKFMQVSAQAEDLGKDEFDYTYEDLLLFQISLIKRISKQYIECPILLVIAPTLTHEIIDYLKEYQDSYTLVLTTTYLPIMKLEEIYLMENTFIDFASMEDVYMMLEGQYHKRYTMEELNNMIKLYLNTYYIKTQKSFLYSLNKLSQ